MKFNEMKYERPDIPATIAVLSDLTARLSAAKTFEEADKIFVLFDEERSKLETMFTLSFIRHTINTADEFYNAENDFSDENGPLLSEPQMNWSLALLASPFRDCFAEKYGELMFTNIEIQLKTFKPEIVPDLQEENRLVSEYDKLIASAQIDFEGVQYTLSQLAPFREDANDERRRAAWNADGGWYSANSAELDRIFDDLTRVRTRIAKKLGYKNFVELGYYRMIRNSYNQHDVEKFREAVKKYIVPVVEKLYKDQAKRTGVPYPLSFADVHPAFRTGNAKPKGSPDDILAHAKKFYQELSPETSEFIDVMFDNELMDVLSRPGKAAGGYETEISSYRCPFIFANFNGTSGDVEVMTHEAGHAFASYTVRNMIPSENQHPTQESCEVHSMSMEFFAWPWEDGFFFEDTLKFKYNHLAGALQFIPYGTMVDHFQHLIYENPEMTPAERHDIWKQLLADYMPWIRLGEVPFYGEGMGWQRQIHIYEMPFYYIDYCLAQTVALEFWALMQKDQKDAWKRYYDFVRLGATRNFSGLIDAAGLYTPFGDDALKTVADHALEWLAKTDADSLK